MLIPDGLGGALLVLRDGLVGASLCVQAGVGQAQALHRATVDEMLADNLINVFQVDEAVPDRFRIDDDGGAVLALVEAASLVGANQVLQSSLFQSVFEGGFELLAARGAATGAGGGRVALVGADEQVVLKFGQGWLLSGPDRCAACGRF